MNTSVKTMLVPMESAAGAIEVSHTKTGVYLAQRWIDNDGSLGTSLRLTPSEALDLARALIRHATSVKRTS